jgi:hypothetical protein
MRVISKRKQTSGILFNDQFMWKSQCGSLNVDGQWLQQSVLCYFRHSRWLIGDMHRRIDHVDVFLWTQYEYGVTHGRWCLLLVLPQPIVPKLVARSLLGWLEWSVTTNQLTAKSNLSIWSCFLTHPIVRNCTVELRDVTWSPCLRNGFSIKYQNSSLFKEMSKSHGASARTRVTSPSGSPWRCGEGTPFTTPRSLVSQAGQLVARRVLVAVAT